MPSPMMRQYHRAKQAAGDALLLFRMGDFYELFYDDARQASRLLGITLTTRDKHKQPGDGDGPTPMAGFPHHQLDAYLAKIIRCGRRAAVCEQLDDPPGADTPPQPRGLVRREITRVVSAGTVTDDALLEPAASNFLSAVYFPTSKPADPQPCGLAWVDVSTGRFCCTAIAEDRLADELVRTAAVECLVAEGHEARLPPGTGDAMAVATRPAWAFAPREASDALAAHFGVRSLDGLGIDTGRPEHAAAAAAAGAVLHYLNETQRASLTHLERLELVQAEACLQIDAATWRSLEVTQTLRDGRREGALLGVVDRTVTPMGARLLAEWLRRPLTDVAAINARLSAVEELTQQPAVNAAVREQLRGVYDLPRLIARVNTGRVSPRDLSHLARTLALLPPIKAKLTGRSSARLALLEQRIDLCPGVRAELEAALAEQCPLSAREGGFVRPGYSQALDDCRDLTTGGKKWMASYQADQQQQTGIPAIKVGFNKVFGYYLEVTHTHREKVPAHYHRKQTLKNAERYITPELKEYEEQVLSAEEKALALELEVFAELRAVVARAASRLLATADALAELDAYAGLADLARSRNYTRPRVVAAPILELKAARHPVLDATEPEGTFVPNDLACYAAEAEAATAGPHPAILLITGPNMAGKSTYVRQSALVLLLAQAGSFVPAERATIGVADRLFARVGASDDVSRGQSTFMVEMVETARILNTATRRSLVLLDEVGRGTSTYDGLSLAWAIVEHLHNEIGCRALFATHYHELTTLAGPLPRLANRSVAVREHAGRVVFLHRIVPRPADKSYGIHVAQLAGVPRAVSQRAAEVLAGLESQTSGRPAHTPAVPAGGGAMQLTLFETADHPVVEALRRLEIETLTPIDALKILAEWRDRV